MNLKYLFSKSKINSSRSYCTYRKDILNIMEKYVNGIWE